mmetsp:Transcript_16701/g.19351  ORF Transcript_16701/g.19351 Transcript_16701/m.19351 type:complete len:101 (-) Transcript_16701:478-780(-)
MESPKFNSIDSRKSSVNPNVSKEEARFKEELDYATNQYLRQGSEMFRKRSHMFSFDGENSSSRRSKVSSVKTSKKSSENSLVSNVTIDLPNTPNFNPTWK